MKHLLSAVLAAVIFSVALAAQTSIVPGVIRLRAGGASSAAERGAVLLGELSCTACHTADGHHLLSRRAPDLSRIGARVTTTWLRGFLLDPQVQKPGSWMPKCVSGEDAAARAADVELLVHYLASRGGPLVKATVGERPEWIKRGRRLYESVGCVSCHEPTDGRKTETPSVPLGKLAHKTTVDELARFLENPGAQRPASRMPDFSLDGEEARAIAMFLLRDQIENPQADGVLAPSQPGLAFDYLEIETNELPDFDLRATTDRGVVREIRIPRRARRRDFALRLRGRIRIDQDGAYTFFLRVNEGARLWIDGHSVVVDDRIPGKSECSGQAELRKGEHTIEVQYFQRGSGRQLQAQWAGPGFNRRGIPAGVLSNRRGRAMIPLESPSEEPAQSGQMFGTDPQKVEAGRSLFVSSGCASCHEPETGRSDAPALEKIDPAREGSCLDGSPTGGGVAYALDEEQRAEIRAALEAKAWARKPSPTASVRRSLAALNCYACHARDDIGGPDAARHELFRSKIAIDLGDEGTVPPPLTGVGDKLRPDVIAAILTSKAHRIRDRFMTTRMPEFAPHVVEPLVEALVAADRVAEDSHPDSVPMAEFSKAAVEAGRRIVGLTGFACVTCHNVNGDRSAAIPGVDLATSQQRLNPKWFRRYLMTPAKYRKDTRMPGFWGALDSPLVDVLDGKSRTQIDAVWTYLSLGKSIPAPSGVQRPAGGPKAELIPVTEPIVHRTFMQGVGPRTILAGFPEKLHVAFDAQGVSMAKVWRGRFFDAAGVASGRTDRFLGPLGGDVLDLPAPAFALLPRADAMWPVIRRGARHVGGRFRGIVLDKSGAPAFHYRLADVDVLERPIPKLRPGGASLRRAFWLRSKKPPMDFYFRAWRGEKIEQVNADTWRSGDVTIRLVTDRRDPVRIRTVDAPRPAAEEGEPEEGDSVGKERGQELVVQFVFRRGEIRFEQEIQW